MSLEDKKNNIAHQSYLLLSQNIENYIRQKNWIKKIELHEWQKEWIKRILYSFEKFFIANNFKPPAFSESKILLVEHIPQYGLGGLDSIIANNIFITQSSLAKNKFPLVFSHLYAHFVVNNNFDNFLLNNTNHNTLNDGILYNVNELNKPGHILLNEGITDMLSFVIMTEMGYKVPDEIMSYLYKQYREVITQISYNIGQNNFRKGFEYFIELYFTGSDKKLREKINITYEKQGGFNDFMQTLNGIRGYPGDIDNLPKEFKHKIKNFASYYGLELYPLHKDRHLKKLMRWARGSQI